MWKVLGIFFLLGGVAGALHSWTKLQKERQKRLGEIIFFLQRTIGVMEREKIKIIDYFARQNSDVLKEIAKRLSTNTYANGQMVWEEVFKEEEKKLAFDNETFQLIQEAGNGFFGRSREENIRFLKKSVRALEEQQKKRKEKEKQERKVWVPVGMLGALMLVIIFV